MFRYLRYLPVIVPIVWRCGKTRPGTPAAPHNGFPNQRH
jgi:hypothetical protein